MILSQIQQNQTKADSALDPAVLAAVYQQLNKWSTTGIKMNIRKNTGTPVNGVAYKGDIFLYMDKAEIEAFLPLLSLVSGLLPEDLLNGSMGPMLSMMIEQLTSSMQQANVLEFGLMPTKNKDTLDNK